MNSQISSASFLALTNIIFDDDKRGVGSLWDGGRCTRNSRGSAGRWGRLRSLWLWGLKDTTVLHFLMTHTGCCAFLGSPISMSPLRTAIPSGPMAAWISATTAVVDADAKGAIGLGCVNVELSIGAPNGKWSSYKISLSFPRLLLTSSVNSITSTTVNSCQSIACINSSFSASRFSFSSFCFSSNASHLCLS